MKKLTLLLALLIIPTAINAEVLKLHYNGFTIWLDCEKRGAVKFFYVALRDRADFPRHASFTIDPKVPKRCQQTASRTYSKSGEDWDRGHMVPANHLDHLPWGIYQSNFRTNILPQTKTLNRESWYHTEKIVECLRDKEPLEVWGGVIWGDDESNDHFVRSHGIKTPDAFWKVIIKKDGVIGWIFPNKHNATVDKLDSYIKKIETIERAAGVKFDIPKEWKGEKPNKSWAIPKRCDLS